METHKSPWMTIDVRDAIYGKAVKKVAEIDIEGDIGGGYWEDDKDADKIQRKDQLANELKRLAELKVDEIIVNIDSPGGRVDHGLSIYDLLRSNPARVVTKIRGMTASIATVIAQAGDERQISDSALMLIHKGSYMVFGRFNKNQFEDLAENLQAIDEKIISIYNKKAKKPDKIHELMEFSNGEGKWISGEEALEVGLVDLVYEPQHRAVAMLTAELLQKYRLPQIPENMKKEESKTTLQKVAAFVNQLLAGEKVPEVPEEPEVPEVPEEPQIPEEPQTPEEPEVPEAIYELEAKMTAKIAELENAKAKIAELETALAQANAPSTKPKGAQATAFHEDEEGDPNMKSLHNDLLKLRAEMSVVRPDIYTTN